MFLVTSREAAQGEKGVHNEAQWGHLAQEFMVLQWIAIHSVPNKLSLAMS